MTLERYVRHDGKTVYRSKIFRQGRCYRTTLGPISKTEAVKRDRQELAKIEAGIWRPKRAAVSAAPVPLLKDFATPFLQWYQVGHRPRSTITYESRLRMHLLPWLGHLRLSEIRTAVIDDYLTGRGREGANPRTMNGELTTLSLLLKKAVERGLISTVQKPTINWVLTESKRIRVLSEREEASLLVAATPRLRPLMCFALQTGLRREELLQLTWSDIDLKHRMVTVISERAKNRRTRSVPLSDTALAALKDTRQFTTRANGRVFGYRSINTMFREASLKAGLPGVSCHTLRHTFATRCLERGISVRTVQRWLGHSSITMTEKYLHSSDAYERAAIHVLDRQAHNAQHLVLD